MIDIASVWGRIDDNDLRACFFECFGRRHIIGAVRAVHDDF
jgi:hypothetical protein